MRNLALFASAAAFTMAFSDSPNLGFCNMSDGSDNMDFSLADLMGLDVTDVAEIRFETLPMGAYVFKVVSQDISEGENREGDKRFELQVKLEIVEVKAVVAKGIEPESLVGKTHTEKFFIPRGDEVKAAEGLGRIRAFVADIGLPNDGPFGKLCDSIVEHMFIGKIIHQKDRDDKSKVYARLKLEPAKK